MTVDDLSGAVPSNAAHLAVRFVKEYRHQLDKLGIKAAPADVARLKSFDGECSGEVLGIWFDTSIMTWQMPRRKVVMLARELVEAITIDAKWRLSMGNWSILSS